MHFVYNAPTAEVQSSKKRKRGEGKAKEERGEPGMNCYGTKDTPLMSWLKRAQVMGLRPGGGTDAGGNGGEGNSGSVGQEAMGVGFTGGAGTLAGGSVGVGLAGTGGEKKAPLQPAKRAARRSRALPKRQYTWRDPEKKNKSGQRNKGKGEAKDVKGKGKE
jgi:hypothetical protein